MCVYSTRHKVTLLITNFFWTRVALCVFFSSHFLASNKRLPPAEYLECYSIFRNVLGSSNQERKGIIFASRRNEQPGKLKVKKSPALSAPMWLYILSRMFRNRCKITIHPIQSHIFCYLDFLKPISPIVKQRSS